MHPDIEAHDSAGGEFLHGECLHNAVARVERAPAPQAHGCDAGESAVDAEHGAVLDADALPAAERRSRPRRGTADDERIGAGAAREIDLADGGAAVEAERVAAAAEIDLAGDQGAGVDGDAGRAVAGQDRVAPRRADRRPAQQRDGCGCAAVAQDVDGCGVGRGTAGDRSRDAYRDIRTADDGLRQNSVVAAHDRRRGDRDVAAARRDPRRDSGAAASLHCAARRDADVAGPNRVDSAPGAGDGRRRDGDVAGAGRGVRHDAVPAAPSHGAGRGDAEASGPDRGDSAHAAGDGRCAQRDGPAPCLVLDLDSVASLAGDVAGEDGRDRAAQGGVLDDHAGLAAGHAAAVGRLGELDVPGAMVKHVDGAVRARSDRRVAEERHVECLGALSGEEERSGGALNAFEDAAASVLAGLLCLLDVHAVIRVVHHHAAPRTGHSGAAEVRIDDLDPVVGEVGSDQALRDHIDVDVLGARQPRDALQDDQIALFLLEVRVHPERGFRAGENLPDIQARDGRDFAVGEVNGSAQIEILRVRHAAERLHLDGGAALDQESVESGADEIRGDLGDSARRVEGFERSGSHDDASGDASAGGLERVAPVAEVEVAGEFAAAHGEGVGAAGEGDAAHHLAPFGDGDGGPPAVPGEVDGGFGAARHDAAFDHDGRSRTASAAVDLDAGHAAADVAGDGDHAAGCGTVVGSVHDVDAILRPDGAAGRDLDLSTSVVSMTGVNAAGVVAAASCGSGDPDGGGRRGVVLAGVDPVVGQAGDGARADRDVAIAAPGLAGPDPALSAHDAAADKVVSRAGSHGDAEGLVGSDGLEGEDVDCVARLGAGAGGVDAFRHGDGADLVGVDPGYDAFDSLRGDVDERAAAAGGFVDLDSRVPGVYAVHSSRRGDLARADGDVAAAAVGAHRDSVLPAGRGGDVDVHFANAFDTHRGPLPARHRPGRRDAHIAAADVDKDSVPLAGDLVAGPRLREPRAPAAGDAERIRGVARLGGRDPDRRVGLHLDADVVGGGGEGEGLRPAQRAGAVVHAGRAGPQGAAAFFRQLEQVLAALVLEHVERVVDGEPAGRPGAGDDLEGRLGEGPRALELESGFPGGAAGDVQHVRRARGEVDVQDDLAAAREALRDVELSGGERARAEIKRCAVGDGEVGHAGDRAADGEAAAAAERDVLESRQRAHDGLADAGDGQRVGPGAAVMCGAHEADAAAHVQRIVAAVEIHDAGRRHRRAALHRECGGAVVAAEHSAGAADRGAALERDPRGLRTCRIENRNEFPPLLVLRRRQRDHARDADGYCAAAAYADSACGAGYRAADSRSGAAGAGRDVDAGAALRDDGAVHIDRHGAASLGHCAQAALGAGHRAADYRGGAAAAGGDVDADAQSGDDGAAHLDRYAAASPRGRADSARRAGHRAVEIRCGVAAAAVDHDRGPELAGDVAGRPDACAAASLGGRDDPVADSADVGRGDVDALPGVAVDGDDPVGVRDPPGHAADDASRHDDADAAAARVAGVDRVPGRGDPAAAGRLRQRDSAGAALRKHESLARLGKRVHDAGPVEGDVERLVPGADRLRLPDQVGAGVHPAAGAGAGAVRHFLPEPVLVAMVLYAEDVRHGGGRTVVVGAKARVGAHPPACHRRLKLQAAGPVLIPAGVPDEMLGNAACEVGVENPGSGHLVVPWDAEYGVERDIVVVVAARGSIGRVQRSLDVKPTEGLPVSVAIQDRDRAGLDLEGA